MSSWYLCFSLSLPACPPLWSSLLVRGPCVDLGWLVVSLSLTACLLVCLLCVFLCKLPSLVWWDLVSVEVSAPAPHMVVLCHGWRLPRRHFISILSLASLCLPVRCSWSSPAAWRSVLVRLYHFCSPRPLSLAMLYFCLSLVSRLPLWFGLGRPLVAYVPFQRFPCGLVPCPPCLLLALFLLDGLILSTAGRRPRQFFVSLVVPS